MPMQNHVSLKGSPKDPHWETVIFLKTPKCLKSNPDVHDFIKEHICVNLANLRKYIYNHNTK